MEVDNVQTQTAAITPLRTPEETEASAQETTEKKAAETKAPVVTEAYRVSISDEAREEEEAANNVETQEATEQLYTKEGTIA